MAARGHPILQGGHDVPAHMRAFHHEQATSREIASNDVVLGHDVGRDVPVAEQQVRLGGAAWP